MALLTSRRLWPLLVTQTLGAVNDNLFKNALVVMILFGAAGRVGGAGPALVAAAGGVFILPYVLFSAMAGQMADRFDKARCIVVTKCAEAALVVLAAVGLLAGSVALSFAVLFGLGVQATFFGPLKYAILPDHLAARELVAGNGLVEAGTFLGILAGTIAGSALFALEGGPVIVSVAMALVALGGVAAALFVRPAPSAAPGLRIDRNPWRGTAALLRTARGNPVVWRALVALSWFWALGSVLLSELPVIVQGSLGARPSVFTLLLAVFSVGVGVGSAGCGRLLRGEVTPRYVPAAALGLSVLLWDFGRASGQAGALPGPAELLQAWQGWRLLADLLLVGLCGGLYSVPLYALIQQRAASGTQARMVAANNVVNALAIIAAAGGAAALSGLGVPPGTALGIVAVMNLAVAGWLPRVARAA